MIHNIEFCGSRNLLNINKRRQTLKNKPLSCLDRLLLSFTIRYVAFHNFYTDYLDTDLKRMSKPQ